MESGENSGAYHGGRDLVEISSPAYGRPSSLLEPILFALIEEIRLGAAQIDNLGAPVPVLLLLGALLAVVSIRYPHAPADDAPPLERPVVALVADPDERARPHI